MVTNRQKQIDFKLNFIALLMAKNTKERFLETLHFFQSCDVGKPSRNTINEDGEQLRR